MNILAAFKPVKAFVLDVDGVLTDNTVLVLENNELARKMSIRDGYALQLAVKKGYHICIISGGSSDAVRVRLEKLGVMDVFMNKRDKKEVLLQFVQSLQLKWEEVLYMGDDIPDIEVMQMAGLACCPADAVPEIKQVSYYISPYNGGEGCVRDVIEKTLKLNGHWNADTSVPSNL